MNPDAGIGALFTCVALLIVYQDFKSRAIHIGGLVALLVLAGARFWIHPNVWLDWCFNQGYILVFYLVLLLVIRFVLRRAILSTIGIGDLIYLPLVALYFDFPSFPIWVNISLIFSLLMHWLLHLYWAYYRVKATIPLAGSMSLVFIIAIWFELYGSIWKYFI